MKSMNKSKLISILDVVVIAAAKLIWKAMNLFDPRPVQTHYAARPPVEHVVISKCFSLRNEDAALNIARLANFHIGSSAIRASRALVGRKGLIKIYNADNGMFLMIRAQGNKVALGERGIPKDGIGLNYDAKMALGIPKGQEDGLNLIVGPANLADSEYYHMYFDVDASSRTARALSWYLAIAGIVYALFQTVTHILFVSVPWVLVTVNSWFVNYVPNVPQLH